MNYQDLTQLVVYLGLLAALTPVVGGYLQRVLDPEGRTGLEFLFRGLERLTYRCLGVDPGRQMDGRTYTTSLLAFSAVGCVFTYLFLRLQHLLPLNPQGLGPLSPHLAFNTAVSFVTNTNWQSYGGEGTMSLLSQMVALTLQNFLSAASGIAVAAALVRGLAGSGSGQLGNFWADLVRITYYLLLPVSLVLAVFLVSQGTLQNLNPAMKITVLDAAALGERAEQTVVQGPMASQVAIKILGTNGGGYANANAAHPIENPTPASNFVQMLAILLIASGLTDYLGRMTGHRRHGWTLWTAMAVLLAAGVLATAWAEAAGNPIHQSLGVSGHLGNLEGKEVRFGGFNSALFAVITTAASCGAVNAMHDSFTPLGGLVPMINMQLGEVIFGGVGAGLYGMLVFVVVAVFLAGLMIGRTPEYLGKRIGVFEIRMAMLASLILPLLVLVPSAVALSTDWGRRSLSDAGPHGLSEVLYAFTSAAANNGSAFAGLNANTPEYNVLLGVVMLAGRFLVVVPVLALAGSLARQKAVGLGEAGFPVAGGTFLLLLLATVLLVGALNFVPALVLGPVLEHFLMLQGRLF